MQLELTEDRYIRLRLHTRPDAKQLRDGFLLTDWHLPTANSQSYIRVAYDAEGIRGLHRTHFTAGTARFASEAGCWHWHVVVPPGTRSGFTKRSKRSKRAKQTNPKKLSLRTLLRVDSYLELYTLFGRDYRRELTEHYAAERFDAPVTHPCRPWRLLSWQRRNATNDGSRPYANKHIRVWVYNDEAQAALSTTHRSKMLVQRTRPGSRTGGACVTRLRNGKVTWSVDLDLPDGYHTSRIPMNLIPGGSKGRLSGETDTESKAFSAVNRALKRLGCKPELYVPRGLEQQLIITDRSVRPRAPSEAPA